MSHQPEEPPNSKIINHDVGASAKLFRRPADPEMQKLIDHVVEHGYVIIENAFTHAEIDEAIHELERLGMSPDLAGPASAHGRNKFEGFQTRRIYALLNKSRLFDKFTVHHKILSLNDYFLDPGWLLNAFHSISIQPGEDPQTLHHDDGFVTLPRPHRPLGTAIMVALDAYTQTNGSTVVVPKSHTWGADRVPSQSETVPVVMPKGSVVYFLGTLWHGGGQNKSARDRRALTVQYCQPWIRPLENQFLAVDLEKISEIPKRIVDMMGYQVGAPFVGYVDGISPRKAAERHLKRWGVRKNTGSRL